LRWAAFEELMKFMAYVTSTLQCLIIFEGLFLYEREKVKVICVNHSEKREVENGYLTTILLMV
jgi:hypothetical protein